MAKAYEDYRGKTKEELNDVIGSLKKELFNLRFQQASGELENTSRFCEVRRNIARAKTELSAQKKKAV